MKNLHGRGLPRSGEADASALHAPEHNHPDAADSFLRVIIKQENAFTAHKNFACSQREAAKVSRKHFAFLIVFIKCCNSALVAPFRRVSLEIEILVLTMAMV